MRYIHKYHKILKLLKYHYGMIEDLIFILKGGDALILSDKIIAIGCSERTSPEAIEVVAKNLFDNSNFEKYWFLEIPSMQSIYAS